MPENSYVAFPDLCGTVLYLTNVAFQTEELKMKKAKYFTSIILPRKQFFFQGFLARLRYDVRVIERESLIVEIYNFYSRSNFFYLIYRFFHRWTKIRSFADAIKAISKFGIQMWKVTCHFGGISFARVHHRSFGSTEKFLPLYLLHASPVASMVRILGAAVASP